MQNHIFSVMKNDNFDMNTFFNQENEKKKKQRGPQFQQPVESPPSVTARYSFTSNKSSPILTRPDIGYEAVTSNQNVFTNVYNNVHPMLESDKQVSNIVKSASNRPAVTPNVYLKWPKQNETNIQPVARISTTTKSPKWAHFDDNDRDFDNMFNTAKSSGNIYGSSKVNKEPVSKARQALSEFKPIIKNRVIYGQLANNHDWQPTHRQIPGRLVHYPQNVYQRPLNSLVSNINRPSLMSSDRNMIQMRQRQPFRPMPINRPSPANHYTALNPVPRPHQQHHNSNSQPKWSPPPARYQSSSNDNWSYFFDEPFESQRTAQNVNNRHQNVKPFSWMQQANNNAFPQYKNQPRAQTSNPYST